jgi:hypothetical protein
MSIDKRSKGVYRFRIQHNKHSYTTTFYGTEKQAKLEHEKFKIAVKSGNIKRESTITLGELWDMYLKSKNLKANTLLRYNTTRKRLSFLLDIAVADITPLIIAETKSKCNSYSYLTTLKTILNYAVELEIIEKNPFTAKLERNYNPKYEELLTKDQIATLINALFENRNKRVCTLLLVQLLCGLRVSEARGLKVSDFDLTNLSELKIQRQYTATKITDDFKEINGDSTTKTQSSNRVVYIPSILHDRLKEVITESEGKYLFSTDGNAPFAIRTVNGRLQKICKDYSLPHLSSHKLRALFTTLSIYSGIDVMSISKTLGHTSTSMTERYLKSINSETKKSYQKINDTVIKLKNLS